jgi:hypothetical protein
MTIVGLVAHLRSLAGPRGVDDDRLHKRALDHVWTAALYAELVARNW